MSIKNKIIVSFLLPAGHDQDKDEVEISWHPINFSIYSARFHELVEEACSEWLEENRLSHDKAYEVIFSHVVEHDGAGAVTGEYFEPIFCEQQWL